MPNKPENLPAETPRRRGRPRLSEEEKRERARLRKEGKLPSAKRPDRALENPELNNPGDNAKFVKHALAIWNMPPVNKADINQVEERIGWYFNHCFSNDMKPTVTGFCFALGIQRSTLMTWKNGTFRADTHQAVILKAYGMLETLWEEYMQNGKINPVSGIFLGKNNFGYQDKTEYVVTPNQTAIETQDVATIEAKYAELPDATTITAELPAAEPSEEG